MTILQNIDKNEIKLNLKDLNPFSVLKFETSVSKFAFTIISKQQPTISNYYWIIKLKKLNQMTNEKTTYIFRFRGYEPEFVQRRGESYIDYKLMYFNEQKEFTEDEFNDYVLECQRSDSKRKLIDWIKS